MRPGDAIEDIRFIILLKCRSTLFGKVVPNHESYRRRQGGLLARPFNCLFDWCWMVEIFFEDNPVRHKGDVTWFSENTLTDTPCRETFLPDEKGRNFAIKLYSMEGVFRPDCCC